MNNSKSEEEEELEKESFSHVLTELEAESLHLMWWAFGVNFNAFLEMPDSVKFEVHKRAVQIHNDKKFIRSIF